LSASLTVLLAAQAIPLLAGERTQLRQPQRAFALSTTPGTFGTANRHFFHGPGFNNTDFGILKRTVLREQIAFDLLIEFFNIFNHAQFMNPGGNINDNGSFGIVTNAQPPRIGQISAKFYW